MTRPRFLLFCLSLALLACPATAQDKNHAAPSNKAAAPVAKSDVDNSAVPQFGQREPRYLLRPGDVFDLQFEFSPEYNQTVSVQPDGFVTLRGIGDVHIAGKNVPELTETLKASYGRFLANPVISIVLKDFEKPYFIANGEVEKPGKYELRGDTTVTEALAIAGGFNGKSKDTQVLLFRRVSQEWVEARAINVKDMLNGKNLNEDVHLKPGDMIFVPKTKWSTIKQFIPYTSLSMNPAAF